MMPRSVLLPRCLFAWWVAVAGSSLAQETSLLRVQPERLQKNREAERKALARHDSLELAEAYYQYGRTYVFAGDYRTSQGYFLKALQLLEPRGDSEALSRVYVRLSENEDRLGRLTDGIRYARQSLAGALQPLGRAYGIMGRVYEHRWTGRTDNQAIYDSVFYYYRREEAVYRRLNDTLGTLEANLELGTLMTKARDPRAIARLGEALRLVDLLKRDRIKVNVLLHTAEAYRTFEKLPLALQTLRAAEKLYIANREDIYDNVLGIEHEYVRYYQTTGQWREAFAHQERANRLVTNQLRSDREASIARLNVEYETTKKEALLRAQQRQLTLEAQNLRAQQRFSLATSALLVVTAGMSLVFYRLNRKNRRISRRNEELVKEQNHRVKNNLQVVSSLLSLQANRLSDGAARRAVEESRLRVQSMAILHQRLYDGDRLAEVELDEFIRDLVAGVLRAYGFTAVQTRFTIDDVILPADKAVPLGLIINELVTNACKYAFPASDRPTLQLDCHRQNNRLHLRVADNGPGLDSPGLDGPGLDGPGRTGARLEGAAVMSAIRGPAIRYRSFGMQLIQAQVEQLDGTYRFVSDGGTVFILELKL